MLSLFRIFSSPPAPTFTEASLIDLASKVYIITHATSREGLELAKILYRLHATVYIGSQSRELYDKTSTDMQKECPDSKGSLKPFIIDPKDLSTTKSAAEKVLVEQWRLDVVFLNTTSANSQHSDFKAHILTSFFLTTLLLPLMHKTASHFCHPNPSIRVVWILSPPSNKSIGSADDNDSTGTPQHLTTLSPYLLAYEFGRCKQDTAPHEVDPHAHTLPNSNPSGVQHVAVAPFSPAPNFQASLQKLVSSLLRACDYRAYTLLYAGLAPDVRTGDWIVPWGWRGDVPERIRQSIMEKEGKGSSVSAGLYAWFEEQARPYL